MNTGNFSWFCHAISRFFFSWCGPFLKFLLNLLQYFFCFMFWVFWSWSLCNLSFLTRDQTYSLYTGRQTHNHWTTREDPAMPFLDSNTLIGSPFPALLLPVLVRRHYWWMTASHANYTTSCSSFTINGLNWIFLSWVPWFLAQKSCLTVLTSGVLPCIVINTILLSEVILTLACDHVSKPGQGLPCMYHLIQV